jgi:NAD(P)-dependent dehydrogenase (short-subunit alcohol dehydrogenase family)
MASILGDVDLLIRRLMAAKHGIVGLTKSAAIEYAKQGVRINSVGPGFINTPLIESNLDEATQQAISGLHAMGRMGEPRKLPTLASCALTRPRS